eukprot:6199214-Pleurochrysis_carterae.AAC.1
MPEQVKANRPWTDARRGMWSRGVQRRSRYACGAAPCTHEDELHPLIVLHRRLEEDRLGVTASVAFRIAGARQRRVLDRVGAVLDRGGFGTQVVDIHQVRLGIILALAVAADAAQFAAQAILLGMEHVAALCAYPKGSLPIGAAFAHQPTRGTARHKICVSLLNRRHDASRCAALHELSRCSTDDTMQ